MAEPKFIRIENESKKETYHRLHTETMSVLDGEKHNIARMATISCMLHHAFENRIWTGFYLVDIAKPEELVVGPYQGSLGCMRIPFGRGVCGAAAQSGKMQLVKNVHDFEGHIACDANSVSEIVVPVRNPAGKLIAVLDIDSDVEAHFDEVDVHELERLVTDVFG